MIAYFTFPGVAIRKFDKRDTANLVKIINDAYSYQDVAKGAPRTNDQHLQQRSSEVDLYVVTKDDQLIGCVYTEPHDTSLHFGLLTLIPEHRGTGLSQALMAAIEAYALAGSYDAIELDYMSLAPWLKAYYETYGFHETGSVIPWGSINLIRMRKQL